MSAILNPQTNNITQQCGWLYVQKPYHIS